MTDSLRDLVAIILFLQTEQLVAAECPETISEDHSAVQLIACVNELKSQLKRLGASREEISQEIQARLRALEARVVSVDFGPASRHAIGEISQANTVGIVTAKLTSEGGSPQGIICGYVGQTHSTPLIRVPAND